MTPYLIFAVLAAFAAEATAWKLHGPALLTFMHFDATFAAWAPLNFVYKTPVENGESIKYAYDFDNDQLESSAQFALEQLTDACPALKFEKCAVAECPEFYLRFTNKEERITTCGRFFTDEGTPTVFLRPNVLEHGPCIQREGAIGNSILHELMHSMGFFHEDARHDRDDHVRIQPEYMREDRKGGYQIATWLQPVDQVVHTDYDYSSLMHQQYYLGRDYQYSTDDYEHMPLVVTEEPIEENMKKIRAGMGLSELDKVALRMKVKESTGVECG